MNQPIICIDGDYGSGNLVIAEKVAKKLGLACHIADDEPIPERIILCHTTDEIRNDLAKIKEDIIYLAQREACVLAEMYVVEELKERGLNVFSVCIQGTLESRVQRVVEEQKIPKAQAHRLVRNRDFCYHLPPKVRMLIKTTDPHSYDFCINTSRISLDEAVERIVSEFEKTQHMRDRKENDGLHEKAILLKT